MNIYECLEKSKINCSVKILTFYGEIYISLVNSYIAFLVLNEKRSYN